MKACEDDSGQTALMLKEIEETVDMANLQALDAVIGASDSDGDHFIPTTSSCREIAKRVLKAAGLVARLVDTTHSRETKITAH